MALKSVYGGLFQDPGFITTDADPTKTDIYDKKEPIPSRYLSKNMLTSPPPASGLRPDVFFDKKFLTLAASDQNDPRIVAEIAKREAREKKRRALAAAATPAISNKTFRYTSFPQKSTGPGTYFGCFPSVTDAAHTMSQSSPSGDKTNNSNKQTRGEAARANASIQTTLPNVKTNPSKKGTYGFPGLLLEKTPYNEHWREELERQNATARKKQKQSSWTNQSTSTDKHPFHLSGVGHSFFDELPATGVSGVYTFREVELDDSRRARKSARRQGRGDKAAATTTANAVAHEKPFSTSMTGRADRDCINPFPNRWLSPEELERAFGNTHKKSHAKSGHYRTGDKPGWQMDRPKGAGEWVPNSSGKTSIISSCLRRFY